MHIYFLIGFRNRLMVPVQWARQRFAGRGVRLVTGEIHPLELVGPEERPLTPGGPVHLARDETEAAQWT